MVNVGEIVVDPASLEDNQDTLYATADQVYKILMQGVTIGKKQTQPSSLFVASTGKTRRLE